MNHWSRSKTKDPWSRFQVSKFRNLQIWMFGYFQVSHFKPFSGGVPSLKLTVCPWKWMVEVGIRSFPIGFRPIFGGELLVSGRVIPKRWETSNVYRYPSFFKSWPSLIPMWLAKFFVGFFVRQVTHPVFLQIPFNPEISHHKKSTTNIGFITKVNDQVGFFCSFPRIRQDSQITSASKLQAPKVQFCLSTNWKRTSKTIGSYWFTASFPPDP